ncbi:MAG TPA: thioredoxin family protein [Chloroflexota bacterium]|nr:thioredoxin family protein [Chloroflexota bacterium]
MPYLKESDRQVLRDHFADLSRPVRLLVFTEAHGCPYCPHTRQLLEEVAGLSEHIELELLDRRAEPELAHRYGIDKVPAIVLLVGGGEPVDTGIRFFGIPSGYEFGTLVDDIVAASRGEPALSPATRNWLATLDRPLHLQVFVTPTCPYCPRAVSLAHRLALASPLIRADMVEATEFPALADRYEVYGVPRTVINDTVAVEGAVPERDLLGYLQEAATRAKQTA